jgi:hypothetical protein
MDVLGAALYADEIAWWQNHCSENFTKHTIDSAYDDPHAVTAADLGSE